MKTVYIASMIALCAQSCFGQIPVTLFNNSKDRLENVIFGSQIVGNLAPFATSVVTVDATVLGKPAQISALCRGRLHFAQERSVRWATISQNSSKNIAFTIEFEPTPTRKGLSLARTACFGFADCNAYLSAFNYKP